MAMQAKNGDVNPNEKRVCSCNTKKETPYRFWRPSPKRLGRDASSKRIRRPRAHPPIEAQPHHGGRAGRHDGPGVVGVDVAAAGGDDVGGGVGGGVRGGVGRGGRGVGSGGVHRDVGLV